MILSDDEIREALGSGEIVVDPLPEDDQFSSSSLDLRLGGEFFRWDEDLISAPGEVVRVDPVKADFVTLASHYSKPLSLDSDGSVTISPRDFIIGITLERIQLPITSGIAARVEGRSSLARMGLQVHLTAPIIHVGWDGKIALELVNHGPFRLKLTPGNLRVCQLVFERVGRPPSQTPGTQFMGQASPTGR